MVTNDDGYAAAGIRALTKIAKSLSDDVWVVAPETNQSGVGHGLTIRRPLRAREIGEQAFAVDGTPTDCVMLGLHNLVKDKPVDLVLSGINHGSNLADDITYSGTVAAAMEATLCRVKAIAFSALTEHRRVPNWAVAERFAPDLIRQLLTAGWPAEVLVNVNFPDLPIDEVKGVKVASQGTRKIGDAIVERVDPRGEAYYWIGDTKNEAEPGEGTDLEVISKGFISVTPIHLDMTHAASMSAMRTVVEG
ncbi:MAG TPA: 5'/3'-nucleotidase SurE [Geminicoccus sp.]|jgi:5'-nucleotidase|uniref:5'/3'-nucleotidase SurE n=1 Tax=Geminicoccus sp. TaxID=2024832 RepID=UPI002E34CC01|nr:5'/3'-nucleotidase SurE [Geminicoccus sp.]HEX2529179.1 5'/3'-nucleotidase SurE [Geminicoccus sp.]